MLSWLLALGGGLAACAPRHAVEAEVAPPPLPDRTIARLSDLVSTVGLEWLVVFRPRALFDVGWLRPSLGRVLKDEGLDALARTTGVQVRAASELAIASYRREGRDASALHLVRHTSSALDLERKFRERLTSGIERKDLGHQLLGVWGRVGRGERGFIAIGPDVAGFEYGGDSRRGPARIALLHAERRLQSSPTASTDEVVTPLSRLFEPAPAQAYLLGPFEGSAARGARGLLGGATGVGVALSPAADGVFALHVALEGDYAEPETERFLRDSFADLGKSDLGALLGLDAPAAPVDVGRSAIGLELRTKLDAKRLLAGLAAALGDQAADLVR
ncbi:MAG: hypothetical protein FJ096_03655 [Deltaproteobacteria bacterium]|nr:hypothetical protein [Deltaproteobacteria bacterium]